VIDNLRGADDWIAEVALARRALQRLLGDETLCGRRFSHLCWPAEFDTLGHLVIDTCVCLRPSGHDHGCVCAHDMERAVYRVDNDGREHYAPRPLEGIR